MTTPWPAPAATGPLDAFVTVPGSKSLTNRHLLLAALAEGPTRLLAPLHSRDSDLMVAALRTLGTTVQDLPGGDLELTPGPLTGGGSIDCGLAGTVMRFVPPVAALAAGAVEFDGDERARQRPMAGVVQGLRALGVRVERDGVDVDTLPFTVHGTGSVTGGAISVDAAASSQFVSALLLVAPRFRDGVELRHVGDRLPSLPHIEMTLETLRGRGVQADTLAPGHWRVAPGPIAGGTIAVEPDLSNAGPFLAAALVAGGRVRVPHWPAHTTQPGQELREILTRMGGRTERSADGVLTVTGTGEVHGIDLDLSRAGELTPTVAALATVATTPSRLHGIAHLRGHETDRLAALVTEIRRLGGAAEELPDGIAITPQPLHGAELDSYHDHRMATFGAVVGLAVPGVSVVDIATTAKTLPDFPAMWRNLVGDDRQPGVRP